MQGLRREREEELVALHLLREVNLRVLLEDLLQLLRLRIGATCVRQPEIVAQIGDELAGEVAQFRGQLGRLLTDECQVLRDLRAEGDHRLTHHHAILRASKAEDIYPCLYGHLPHGATQMGASIGQASPIHVKIHLVGVKQICDCPYLVDRIDCTQLRHL